MSRSSAAPPLRVRLSVTVTACPAARPALAPPSVTGFAAALALLPPSRDCERRRLSHRGRAVTHDSRAQEALPQVQLDGGDARGAARRRAATRARAKAGRRRGLGLARRTVSAAGRG